MKKLTVVFLTENKLPKKWTEYHKKVLLEAVGKNDLITISRKPLDMGLNLIQKEPSSLFNIYRQMLRGFKVAKTEFVAIAEDDTLYHRSHFNNLGFRKNAFVYNLCNWKLFNWGTPTYHWTSNFVNYTLTAPRKLAIEALEERFNSGWKEGSGIVGELGRMRVERKLGVSRRPLEQTWSTIPIININHDGGFDEYARRHCKRMGMLRAFNVPHWGRADELIKHFNEQGNP